MGITRNSRRDELQSLLTQDPFLTDLQLAEALGVSVATIRLDRMALDIPELRERTKIIASKTYTKLKSIQGSEVIGELIDIEVGAYAISILSVLDDMVLERTKILRGHHLFAQGNSLAVAIVNWHTALTASAKLRYHRPVTLSDRVIAKASLIVKDKNHYTIQVESRVQQELVFQGEFVVVALNEKEEGDSHKNRS